MRLRAGDVGDFVSADGDTSPSLKEGRRVNVGRREIWHDGSPLRAGRPVRHPAPYACRTHFPVRLLHLAIKLMSGFGRRRRGQCDDPTWRDTMLLWMTSLRASSSIGSGLFNY